MTASTQPVWKLMENLGDVNPIDHGGFFVYRDMTGQYAEQAELVEADGEDEYGNPTSWTVYRFDLDRCTYHDGVLSDNSFHPELPAWFATPESRRAVRPQDTTYLSNVAEFSGGTILTMINMLCSDDARVRAHAYRDIAEYHGWDNFDSYPLVLTDRAEVEARYAQ